MESCSFNTQHLGLMFGSLDIEHKWHLNLLTYPTWNLQSLKTAHTLSVESPIECIGRATCCINLYPTNVQATPWFKYLTNHCKLQKQTSKKEMNERYPTATSQRNPKNVPGQMFKLYPTDGRMFQKGQG